jgi:integrase/recombinase XerD
MKNLNYYIIKFEAYLLTKKGLAANTLRAYMSDLVHYEDYLKTKHETEIQDATSKHLKSYLRQLKSLELLPRSVSRKISSLKVFYAFLETQGFANISSTLVFPAIDKKLPNYLSPEEVDRLLLKAQENQTDHGKQFCIALMLLYATGLRASELVGLKIADIQFDTGLITVLGKGGKGRLVPVPLKVLTELKNYLDNYYFKLAEKKPTGNMPLLVCRLSGQLRPHSRQWVWLQLQDLAIQAEITRKISPHVLRHSLATHLLKNGADLRTLQMLLGHENVKTVEIYTHLDTSHLRKLYDKKHPRAK